MIASPRPAVPVSFSSIGSVAEQGDPQAGLCLSCEREGFYQSARRRSCWERWSCDMCLVAAATETGPGHNAMAKMHAAKQSVRNLLSGAWSTVLSGGTACCSLCVTIRYIMCSPSVHLPPHNTPEVNGFHDCLVCLRNISRGARFWCQHGCQPCAAREDAKGPAERQKRAGGCVYIRMFGEEMICVQAEICGRRIVGHASEIAGMSCFGVMVQGLREESERWQDARNCARVFESDV